MIRPAGPRVARAGAKTAELTDNGLPYDVGQARWLCLEVRSPPTALLTTPPMIMPDGVMRCSLMRRATLEDVRQVDLDQDWFWRIAAHYRIGPQDVKAAVLIRGDGQ